MNEATCSIDAGGCQPAVSTEIGRTKAIIVFANGGDPRATITPIIARVVPETASEIRFAGVVAVENDVVVHANEVVLPLVDRICTLLGVQTAAIAVEMVNVGAASSSDRAVRVSGLSAELPLFLAALSARLLLPIPQDVVATGHIGSLDGDVRIVRNMPAKLKAAVGDPSVSRFLCPRIHADTSMQTLKAAELAQIDLAMSSASQRLCILEVDDIVDAIRVVFDGDAMVLASLQVGFFGTLFTDDPGTGTALRAGRYICDESRPRFLKVLQHRYESADVRGVSEALELWADAHHKRNIYPQDFGRDTLILLASLPPRIRRSLSMDGALVPTRLCRMLTDLASEDDEEDLQLLYRAAAGIWSTHETEKADPTERDVPVDTTPIGQTVQNLLAGMDAEYLGRTVGVAIDDARESFLLESVLVKAHRDFVDIVASFFLHLQRSTGRVGGATSVDDAAPEAIQLLERAFNRAGGFQGARAEGATGAQGGCRFVLDRMVEQYKQEKQQAHLTALFAKALDPLAWESKVAVITELLKRHPCILPPDLRAEPPERFAARYQDLVRAYVRCLDGVRQVARTM